MKKALIILVAILLLAAAYYYSSSDGNFFQGQLLNAPNENEPSEAEVVVDPNAPKPDLMPDMEVIVPEDPLDDLEVNAKIINLGPGSIDGSIPFVYGIYMNGALVFSNTDSYTTM